MAAKQVRAKIQSCLVRGDLKSALNLLISSLGGGQQRQSHDSALMLKAKWESIRQEQLRGVLSRQEYEVAISKIIEGIQMIVNEIDDSPAHERSYSSTPIVPRATILAVSAMLLFLGAIGWFMGQTFKQPTDIIAPLGSISSNPASPNTTPNTIKSADIEIPGKDKKRDLRLSDPTVEPPRHNDTMSGQQLGVQKRYNVKVVLNSDKQDWDFRVEGLEVQVEHYPNFKKIKLPAGKYRLTIQKDGQKCSSAINLSEDIILSQSNFSCN